MAQLVVAAAGAWIGSFAISGTVLGLSGAAIGWGIGSLLGSMVGPSQKSQGPRLNDLRVMGTEYGQPIAYLRAHPRVAPQVIWASERREISTTTEVGKGGGAESTQFTYEVDLLLLLSDNEIAGVSRMWDNGELIFTALSDAAGSSLAASAYSERWARMTVYTGDEDQLPDPTYEAAVGVGNAPAYRGRGTVFFEGFSLGSSGVIPNLTMEVPRTAVVDKIFDEVVDPLYSIASNLQDVMGSTGHRIGEYEVLVANYISFNITRFSVTESRDGTTVIEGAGVLVGAVPVGGTAIAGPSDESCFVVSQGGGAGVLRVVEVSGNTDYTTGGQVLAFARRNGTMVVATGTSTIIKLPSLLTATGTYAASKVAIGKDKCWALRTVAPPREVYEFDLETMVTLQTVASPYPGSQTRNIFCDDDDILYITNGSSVHKLTGSTWTLVATLPGSAWGDGGTYGSINIVDGRVYDAAFAAHPTPMVGRRVTLLQTLDPEEETIQSVVEALCERAGLAPSQFDATALASITKPVRALAVSQVSATRATLEQLAAAYFFECVLSDKLYFIPRGGSSVASIPYADIGASLDEGGAPEPFALRIANDLEIPAEIAVSYANVDADYNTATETSDRLVWTQGSTSTVQLAMGLTASEAKAIADAMLMDQLASRVSAECALLPEYTRLQPTDVITPTSSDGTQFRMRVVRKRDSAGLVSLEAVLDDASALASVGLTSTYTGQSTVTTPAGTVLELMDIPILRDADNAMGIYGAVEGDATPYPGATMYRGLDGVSYSEVANFGEQAIIGTCTTTLGAWAGGNRFDDGNTVTVDVGEGTLSSDTHANVLDADANACLIGSEVLQFKTATLVSTGVYRLAGLLRGRRGTEWAMSGHGAGERFVLLRMTGLRRVGLPTSDLGALRYYKGVTAGRKLSTATEQTLTLEGVALKPFSPVDLRGERDASDNLTGTFSRRTRLGTSWASTTAPPLGEDAESYEIDIYADGTFTTVLRTIAVTAETFAYSAADQTTDFGSPQAHGTLNVGVFQISGTVGRGYELQGVL